MVYEIYVWLILFCFLVAGTRLKRETSPFEKDDSLQIKGLCCLLIVSHHLYTWDYLPHDSHILEQISNWLGPLAVGVFFFLSAYGLILSYERGGKKYLKKIVLVKIPTLYLSEVLINVLTFFTFEFKNTTLSPLEQFLKVTELAKFKIGNSEGQWFINTLILCYLLFAVVYFALDKFKDKKFSATFLSFAILALFALFYKWIYEYRRAVTCFCLGLVYAASRDSVNTFCKKYFWFLLPLSFALFVGATIVDAEQLGALALCVFVVILMQRVKFKSPIFSFVGKIGLEMYLIHVYFIRIFRPFRIPSFIYYVILPYTCAIFGALIFYYFRKLIAISARGIKRGINKTPVYSKENK